MAHNKTGYFVRAERDGKYITIDIANLTEEEWDGFLTRQGPDRAKVWAKALLSWINEHVVFEDDEEEEVRI